MAGMLPKMASGASLGAFALTEPGAGSDIQKIESNYVEEQDVLLVFGKWNGKPITCLVETSLEGVKIDSIKDMIGFIAACISEIEFKDCRVSKENLVGRIGFALSLIAPYSLEYGKISVAFTALGILQGCLEISSKHSVTRKAFDFPLIKHELIAEKLTDMGVDFEARFISYCLAEPLPNAMVKIRRNSMGYP